MLDNNVQGTKQKVTFNLPPENFAHTVKVLMMGYVLVSANDPPGMERCTLEAAKAHIDIVEHYSRLDSLAQHQLHYRIMEIEMAVRNEWGEYVNSKPNFRYQVRLP